VTWKRGLEASFRFDLAYPCDLFLAEKLLQRVQAAESSGGDEGSEELRECKLNDEPLDPTAALPSTGILQAVYFSTLQQDALTFDLTLDLTQPNDRAITLRLWERALTTPTDSWVNVTLDGATASYDSWQYPAVPDGGNLTVTYSVRLAIKPYDRGVFFSPPMSTADFKSLAAALTYVGEAGEHPPMSDHDRIAMMKQAASRNYFSSAQVRDLVDLVALRKSKIEAAVLLHARCTDQANFIHALQSIDKETDRQDILEMVGASIKRKLRTEIKSTVVKANATVSALTAAAAAAKAPAAAEPAP